MTNLSVLFLIGVCKSRPLFLLVHLGPPGPDRTKLFFCFFDLLDQLGGAVAGH